MFRHAPLSPAGGPEAKRFLLDPSRWMLPDDAPLPLVDPIWLHEISHH
jgi:hypothetical protein